MKPATFLLLAALSFATTLRAVDVVDNLANASSGQIVLDEFAKKGAQAFTTGPEFATLDSVTVRLRHILPPSPPFGSSTARVTLFSGDGDVPETQIELVGTVNAFSDDTNFTVNSTTNTLLLPDTRYWIVVSNVLGDFDWRSTTDSSVTPASTGGLPDFRATATDAEWTAVSTGNFQKMKVVADPVPGITVTNVSDDKDTPPDGSLRKAIADALPGATITFGPSLTDPIVLDGEQLAIDKNLVIDGSGLLGGISIDGDDRSRVFVVNAGNTVVMRNLTITGGRAPDGDDGDDAGLLPVSGGFGGGIYNGGILTLQQTTVSGNRAGNGGNGVDNFAGSGGFGGGIYNGGMLTLQQTTVSGNRAGDGGADNGVGGVDGFGGFGGGIANEGMLTLQQTTVSDNRTGNGITGGGDGGSGGGITQVGENFTASITNSIIAGNFVGGGENRGLGPDLYSDSNTTVSGINLIGDNTLGNGSASTVFPAPINPGEPNANGDFVGTGAAPLDPLLGPLADNGGPTQTHLPLRGSPAIDPPNGATTSPFATDQDGFPRIVAGILDIGSVEAPDYAAIDAAAAEAAAQAAAVAAAQAQAAARAAQAAAAAQAQAAARAAQQADLSKKLKKLKKKFKNAKRKGQASKAKKLKKQIKSLTKQMRAL